MHEEQRLQELRSFRLLDTPPEPGFDRITTMAADIFGMPVALVSLLDADRQYFKSAIGLDVRETPRDISFCTHTIRSDAVMTVPDSRQDPRFAGNPLVTGAPHIHFYSGAPLVTESGARLGTLCVIDHAPRGDFGARQEALLASLAAMVVDEMQLRKLSKVAEDASRAKSDFLAHMSHELRTPLSAVIGGIGVFDRLGPLTPAQREMLATIRSSADSLYGLVNDSLDILKIESRKFELASERLSYLHLLEQTGKMLGHAAQAKGLELALTQDGLEGLEAVGDATRLRQILVNLVGNAVKFTGRGFVRVHGEYDAAQGRFLCSVADSGPGIPEEEQEAIFEPYRQRTGQRGGGTGLGLPICRELAQLMGGGIALSSRPGEGSVFTLSIPHRPVEAKRVAAS